VAVNSQTVAATALRFFYAVTLKQDRVIEMIPTPRPEHRLPVILSPQEVLRLLEAAPYFSQRVIFSTMYGTGMGGNCDRSHGFSREKIPANL